MPTEHDTLAHREPDKVNMCVVSIVLVSQYAICISHRLRICHSKSDKNACSANAKICLNEGKTLLTNTQRPAPNTQHTNVLFVIAFIISSTFMKLFCFVAYGTF